MSTGVGKVELSDLMRCLDDGSVQEIDAKKRLRRVAKKDKVLDVPLNKHELEKVFVLHLGFRLAGSQKSFRKLSLVCFLGGFQDFFLGF